ncbi:Abscisic acid-insensitive 5-like protein [Quillaja saponaria]|uniref:Abscisic acid-insensitive 5-like protein n=1 Tax=Quillaja saponaria TaxID=32244 RepID=A0AAD7PAR6_QUISA|nr:Abscisic acid-insensitive 5-like protein [Quillaja saponaria]
MILFEKDSTVYETLNPEYQPPPQPEVVPLHDPSSMSSLSRQDSITSLKLAEIQCKSGRSFGSMSVDEFLASIWLPDENQFTSQPNNDVVTNNNCITAEPTFCQQASLATPNPICKKSVDGVWSEIHKDQPQGPQQHAAKATSNKEPLDGQQTFGEMTLEDFLIQAGVVQASIKSSQQETTMPAQTQTANFASSKSPDASFGVGQAKGTRSSNQQNVRSYVSNNGLGTYQMFPDSTNNDSTENYRTQSRGNNNKKRIIDGPPEVVMERRQRRMLKNRESAARSRARKLAYTVELEIELKQLIEKNQQLKQSVAELDRKRIDEVEKRLKHSTKAARIAERLKTIRKTVSLSW